MVYIQDSSISNCHVVGVYCQGQGAQQQLIRLKLTTIQGSGIHISKGNQAKIKGCEVTKTKIGIEVISA